MINVFFHALSSAFRRGEILSHRGDEELRSLAVWIERDHTAEVHNEPAETELDHSKIRALIKACARCCDAGDKKISFGNGTNGVMILLHLPEKVKGEEMKYYRADANEMMKKMMAAINVNITECYITNLIKCEGSATCQPSSMFISCADILREEMKEVNPAFVIVMGAFTPVSRLSKEFSSVRWFNIEHPVTILKNPELKRPAWETLLLVRAAREQAAR
jgi:uracil-DNA glycosylase